MWTNLTQMALRRKQERVLHEKYDFVKKKQTLSNIYT